MKSGFNIEWTQNAKKELGKTIEYLKENFSEKEIKKLVQKIENITELISQNQNLFPKSKSNNIQQLHTFFFNHSLQKIKIHTDIM